jgi:esterase/lipase superfamily enzyme
MIQLYPINLIAFDYPSKKMNKNPISNYYLSKKNIRNSLVQFHQLILELEEGSINNVKISLMSHSLGGYFIANYLKKFENHTGRRAL